MKLLTTTLTVLAMGTLFVTAADEKPAKGPAVEKAETAAKPEAQAKAAGEAKPGAGPAVAKEGAKPKADPEKMFKKLDSNSDGKVSAEEFKASPGAQKDLAKAEASFAKKDKDSDKSLTLEEFSAMGKKKK